MNTTNVASTIFSPIRIVAGSVLIFTVGAVLATVYTTLILWHYNSNK